MSNFDKAADGIASNLDASKADDVARQLSQYSQQLSREDFRSLLKTVDTKENDGVGLDLVIKYDALNTPEHYSVLPADQHATAKKMAGLMDSGKTADAVELLNKTAREMDAKHPGDAAAVQQEFSRWALAVDKYEQDGTGSDISIDLTKPGVKGLNWQFQRPAGSP